MIVSPRHLHVVMALMISGAMWFSAVGMAVALFGCANSPSPHPPHEHPARIEPGVRGADAGLEMLWWIVSGDGAAVGAALHRHVDRPIPVPETMRERWRLNGLRLVSVPLADLDAIARELPLAGPVDRQWLGQRPAWTDAVRGPHLPHGILISLDSGDVMLEPGRLRLLARCWAIPMPPPTSTSSAGSQRVGAGLRLELAPQHVLGRRPEAQLEVDTGQRLRARIEDEGMIFRRLVLEMIAVEGEALVIVPEAPSVDWSTVPSGDVSRMAPAAGPPLSPTPTLGEAMLSLSAVEASRGAKAIIVLVPRTPERFELIREGR